MKNTALATLSALLFTFATAAHAGSVTLPDIEGVLKSNPRFIAILDTLGFEQNGTSNRLGRHYGTVGGARVGPYTFKARANQASGPTVFNVILHTNWHLEDNDGNTFIGDPPEPPSDNRPLHIRERLTRIEINDNTTPPNTPAGKPRQPSRHDPKPPGRTPDQDQSSTNTEPNMPHQPPAGPSPNHNNTTGSTTLSGTFAQGDYLYAAEYYCDNYLVKLKAGDTLQATLSSVDAIPEIMTRKNQWTGSKGPRHSPQIPGEPAQITYTAEAEDALILLITNKNKHTPGTYQLAITINGQPLTPPNPLPAPHTDKRIIPLN
ncbi:hypothetical protein FEM03_21905 [Phragmitibacter flavus]|uniref:Uncharacterized protein n=1 Tax=Phragmitibacter flavus TaxID=2576071 RepID=A0A5R8K8E0_9BACT|nr:hypothetical protein [Phragmitibacter flavus]TLD68576.1 hypothetical protein FEM03_21905 [Phragmitibacter flavus]